MRPELRRIAALAEDLLKPGGIQRLKRRLEARFFGAVLDTTRLTNDGGYRRYREDSERPREVRGHPEHPEPGGQPSVRSAGSSDEVPPPRSSRRDSGERTR